MTLTGSLHLTPQPMNKTRLPGRVVLVMQGGGALGSYQAGAYQALHEAGIEPDWVIGTSIGAINGAIIAGNEVVDRVERLQEFWGQLDDRVWATEHQTQRCKTRFTTWLSSISSLGSRPLEKWVKRISIRCMIGYCCNTPSAMS